MALRPPFIPSPIIDGASNNFLPFPIPKNLPVVVVAQTPQEGDFGPFTPGTQTDGIQEALNYVSSKGGGIVYIKRGSYYPQAIINVPSNVAIIGEDNDATIIYGNSNAIYTLSLVNVENVLIKNLRLSENNAAYVSSIFIAGSTHDVTIENCRFTEFGNTWFIQFGTNGLSSSSPPSVYTHDINILYNDFDWTTSYSSTLETFITTSTYNVRIIGNRWRGTSGLSGFAVAIYDFSHDILFKDNVFDLTQSPINAMYVSDGLRVQIEDNTFLLPPPYNYGNTLIGLFYVAQQVVIKRNVAIGYLSTNANSFGQFISIGLQTAASQGPDGNVSQNSGYVDDIIIEDNVILGGFQFGNFSFSGSWLPSGYFVVRNNVFGFLRANLYTGPSSSTSATLIFENNADISDIFANGGSGVIGNGSPWFAASNWGAAIIRNNRFPKATDFSSSTALNNVSVSNVSYAVIEGNIIGGSGQPSAGVANYLSISNVSTAIVRGNIKGDTMEPLILEPSTPSVPSSGTAVTNTNPYPVTVYLYGGSVTEVQITPAGGSPVTVFSSSSGVAMTGQGFRLNPGDSITITYSTAPSWVWLAD